MKYKVGKSKIEGEGLFTSKELKENELIGLAHLNNEPTEVVGKYHNHSDNPNAYSVKIKNKRFIYALRDLKPGEEITVDYTKQPELEQPESFKKGGQKKYTRDITATNFLNAEHFLTKKPKKNKKRIYSPNAKYYAEGGEAGCPPGYAFNPVTGECIEWNPTVWSSEEQSTSYDPVGDIIYMNPNDRPEGMSDEEYQQMYQDQIEHEQLHRLQWINDGLKGTSKTPLRMPSTADNQEYDGEHYYNRRTEEEAYLHDMFNQANPELAKFIPNDVVYDKVINPSMYDIPWTEEGEARGYEGALHNGMESLFPKRAKGGAKYQDGGVVQFQGVQYKQNPKGEWVFADSGAPVTDKLVAYKLPYEGKPVGSPVVQGAPKPKPISPVTKKQELNTIKNSPVIADQQKAKQLEKEIRFQEVYYPEAEDILPATTLEDQINNALGYPMDKGQISAEAASNEGQADNYRHAAAGRYAAEAIEDMTGNIPYLSPAAGFIGSNLLGVGHEAKVMFNGMEDRPWSTVLRESGEDLYNNFVGAKTGASDMTPEQKTNYLLYLSNSNQLPDGVVSSKPGANQYVKRGPKDPGKFKSRYQNGGEATDEIIWAKDENDPIYQDYLIKKALYDYSNNPNFNLRSDATYELSEALRQKDLSRLKKFSESGFYDQLIEDAEGSRNYILKENGVLNEQALQDYESRVLDPNRSWYGSPISYSNLSSEELRKDPNFQDENFALKEYLNDEFFSKYPPEYWTKQSTYDSYPFTQTYGTNENVNYGSSNFWTKPNTLFIEDEIDRAALKKIYPNMPDSYIDEYIAETRKEPNYITNSWNPKYNYYEHAQTYDEKDYKYNIPTPVKTFVDPNGLRGYIQDSVTDNITQDFDYLPYWAKPKEVMFMPERMEVRLPEEIEIPKREIVGTAEEFLAPEYTTPGYKKDYPYFYMAHHNSNQIIPHARLKRGEFANLHTTPLNKIVQKVSGYNPKVMEGFYDEEGEWVPGEIEQAQQEGRKIEFQGLSSLQDRKAQEQYNAEYDKYLMATKYPQMMLDGIINRRYTSDDLTKNKRQYGGLVEVRGYEGNKFKKNASGKWEYESGRPVEDQLLIQKLTYESKPVGSPVVQGAPKPAPLKPIATKDIPKPTQKIYPSRNPSETTQQVANMTVPQAPEQRANLEETRKLNAERKFNLESFLVQQGYSEKEAASIVGSYGSNWPELEAKYAREIATMQNRVAARQQGETPDKMSTYTPRPEQPMGDFIQDVVFNPFTSAGYLLRGQEIPDYMGEQIDNGTLGYWSNGQFVQGRNALDTAIDVATPIGWAHSADNIINRATNDKSGDFWTEETAWDALNILPGLEFAKAAKGIKTANAATGLARYTESALDLAQRARLTASKPLVVNAAIDAGSIIREPFYAPQRPSLLSPAVSPLQKTLLPKGKVDINRAMSEADASKFTRLNNMIGAPTGTINLVEQVLGEVLQGNKNRKAIAAGNEWLDNWISHPITQNKVNVAMDWAKIRGLAGDPEIDLIREQSLKFKPISAEYPLSNQVKENLQQYKGNNSQNIHQGNAGVSYTHGVNPFSRDSYAFKSPWPEYGSWISRSPLMSSRNRTSTTIHEGTHDWTSRRALDLSGQRDAVMLTMNPDMKKDFLEWEGLRAQGKSSSEIDKIMGVKRSDNGYYSNPTEMHARIMELRKHFNLTPDKYIDPNTASDMIKKLESMPSYKQPINVKMFLKVIDKKPDNLAYLFNRLWAIPPALMIGDSMLEE